MSCILDVVLMYFSCLCACAAVYGVIKNNINNNNNSWTSRAAVWGIDLGGSLELCITLGSDPPGELAVWGHLSARCKVIK